MSEFILDRSDQADQSIYTAHARRNMIIYFYVYVYVYASSNGHLGLANHLH